jgi:hypothetical protein
MGCKMGESAICSLNTPYSISLLMPVYRKSMIKRTEMISTMVDFDNQVNESSLTDVFRCCITGPSMVKWFDKCLMVLERAVSATAK